jgi:MFS family permease
MQAVAAGLADVRAFPALVAGTVPSDLLGKGNGLSSVGYSLAGLAGPLIGGALVTAVGAGLCFAINALSDALVVGAGVDALGIEDALLVCAVGIAGFGVFSLVDSRRPVKEPPAIPAAHEHR